MIRRLEHKDAALMLEWMHEEDINRAFRQPFGRFTAEHAVHFIDNSFNEKNRHFAVVNESDEYLGTVSLKIYPRQTARRSMPLSSEVRRGGRAWQGGRQKIS